MINFSFQVFFIDHVNRKTSFLDPRVPTECPRIRLWQEQDMVPTPPPRPPRPTALPRVPVGIDIPIAYNDKVSLRTFLNYF